MMRPSDREYNQDFDRIVSRKGTESLKYDFAVQRGKPEGILPLWVADMDFPTSSGIIAAIKKRADHGIFGYSEADEGYYDAVISWMRKRHSWDIRSSWIVKTPGVVFALAMAVRAYTDPADAVMIQQPVYYPFSEVIRDNGRVVVNNALKLGNDGKYRMDPDDFEYQIRRNKVRLFLLCNPHNPVGRVWTKKELSVIGGICAKYGVTVVSDEIHEDFVFPEHEHHVFAKAGKGFAAFTITCTSPGKTFNLAGLQVSNIVISDPGLRKAFRREIAAAGYSQINTMGLVACEAAYRNGGEWFDALRGYLKENLDFLREYLKEKLPEISLIEPEGTYLIWLDFRKLNLTEKQREDMIVNRAGLWLDSGAVFGADGTGFERINIACPRRTLKKALSMLRSAVYEYSK